MGPRGLAGAAHTRCKPEAECAWGNFSERTTVLTRVSVHTCLPSSAPATHGCGCSLGNDTHPDGLCFPPGSCWVPAPTCVSLMSPRTAPSFPVDPFLSSSDTRAPGSPLLACPHSTGKVQAASGHFRGHGQAVSSLTAFLCSSGFQFHLHAPRPRSTYSRLCTAFPKVLHRGPP